MGPFSGFEFQEKLGVMKAESKNGKDSLKVEKWSLLVLSLCIVALVYVLVARPF